MNRRPRRNHSPAFNGSPLRSFILPQRLQIAICVDFRYLRFARPPEKVTGGLRVTSSVNVRQSGT